MSKVKYTIAELFLGGFFVAAIWLFAYGLPSFTSNENWPALIFGFGGTLLGALIGAVTSYLISTKEKLERQKTDTYSIFVKAQVIYSDFVFLNGWIRKSIEDGDQAGMNDEALWKKVTPLVGIPKPVAIAPRELAIMAEAKEFGLLRDLITLGMRHTAGCEAANTFSILRTELRDLLNRNMDEAAPENPGRLRSNLTKQEFHGLQPRFAELNSLIAGMTKNLNENVQFSENVLKRIAPAARQYFGEKHFTIKDITFDDPDNR